MGVSSHVSRVLEAAGKKSLFSLIFSYTGLKMFADGNIGYMKLIKGPNYGEHMGTDKFGNRYYENNSGPWHRKRWVLYHDEFDYNPTTVPAEWHGWLEGISDFRPGNYEFPKPIYGIEHFKSKTGTPECYNPKGAWKNDLGKRNWKKVEFWTPPPPSA
ncbi:hypothetical protein FOA52_015574 [Chlamydomonas sp. UWO 241]|nr:hypothetical protein FOA52_015574 [Chlamydomonas sp. UWO 241]